MAITVQWDNAERTVLLYTFEGEWTVEEFLRAIEQGSAMLQRVEYADVIIDLTGSPTLPINFSRVLDRLEVYYSSNSELAVVVGASRFVTGFAIVFQRIYPKVFARYTLARSTAQARDIIRERRGVPGIGMGA